jgi:uncharacterized protein (DUF58 family)
MQTAEEMKRFLDPKTLAKIERLDLIARLVVEGFVTGLHKSPYHGFSVEFAEHREYAPGDDIKHVDWKVYGRTDRYCIKEYEEETNLGAHILLDASESMAYKSGAVSKLEYGQFVAASLAYLILNQRDSVGLATFDNEVRSFLPPSQHASHLKLLIHELSKVEPREKSAIGDVLHAMAERIRRKGLVIVISDLLDDPSEVLFGLRHLRHKKHEVILFHVLDSAELEFPFSSTVKFEGLEGLLEEVVDPVAIRKGYLAELRAFLDQIRRGCRNNRIDHVLLDTSQPLDVALSTYLARRSGIKLK